jgi:four helix bundle protein
MGINSFRELRVWEVGMRLVEDVYRLTKTFPKYETYGLSSQMQRAPVSIPANIAEGHARRHVKEYLHHLSIAQASRAELQTQLEIAVRLKYLSPEQSGPVLDRSISLARQLHALRNALACKERKVHEHKSPQSLTPNPNPALPDNSDAALNSSFRRKPESRSNAKSIQSGCRL